ncbi:MAG: HEAT repeat domain-containing protein [Phycisphaerales bacterium]|nr:MAG: HEAT repeat domain-containing protein [Phycisphaerales bacterium]
MFTCTSTRVRGRRVLAWETAVRLSGLALTLAATAAWAQEPEDVAVAPPAGRPAADELTAEQLYVDFVHFVMLGRYDIAEAYGQRLLDHAEADADALLDIADENPKSRESLTWAQGNAKVGPIAKAILERIAQGEFNRRTDVDRINSYIEGLAGGARAELNNAERLRESGEYAIPWMIRILQDPKRAVLHARIARTLPKIGRDAVDPLCAALAMDDAIVKQSVIRALGELGYSEALPYLRVVIEDPDSSEDVRRTAAEALAQITTSDRPMFSMNAAEAMYNLAANYWINAPGIRADPRDAETSVWEWRDGFLHRTPVPTAIYDDVMAMRSCETVLRLDADDEAAVALWLAANFRREAELGMDVESEEPDDARQALDRTRPDGFLRGVYYARSAGPRICQRVLSKAIDSGNAAVALGAIAALNATAGAEALVGYQDAGQPLVRAMVFPDLAVRIKAALTIARALPKVPFDGADAVVPVLADALAQTGQLHAVIVDPDPENRNRVAKLLSEEGVVSVAEGGFLEALTRGRKELPNIDAVLVASDIAGPGLMQAVGMLKSEYRFANTPVILMHKSGDKDTCLRLSADDARVGVVPADAPKVALTREWEDAAVRVGRIPLTAEDALDLALEAAGVLGDIALSNSPVFAIERAENALVGALQHPAEELRIRAAGVLAFIGTSHAQNAIADAALDPDANMSLRLPAFAALAESAKLHGNLLGAENLNRLMDLTMHADDPVVRTNASRALGALNLAARTAAEIVLGK